MFELLLVLLASVIASAVVLPQRRYLTWIATAGVLAELHWLTLTVIARSLNSGALSAQVYAYGSVILLLTWTIIAVFTSKRAAENIAAVQETNLLKELAVAVTIIIVLAAASSVAAVNGWQGSEWVAHGFYNGDTATLVALTEQAIATPGWVSVNPFAAGASLEYPTLVHSGLAAFFTALGKTATWTVWLPLISFMQIIITIPLFFLVWDQVQDVPRRWAGLSMQALIVLYVIALSWDGYIYPQGHFFTTALFLLLTGLCVHGFPLKAKAQCIPITAASLSAVLLLLANAVTGTAAVGILLLLFLWRAVSKDRPRAERLWFSAGIAAYVLLFFLFTPGDGSLGLVPRFAYTAIPDLLKLLPPLALVTVGMATAWEYKQRWMSVSVLALTGLALVTFFFSQRNIVIDNASRFMYHGLLIGFPLMISGVHFLVDAARYRTSAARDSFQLGIRFSLTLLAGVVLILPPLASVASAHSNLQFNDRHITNNEVLAAMLWLKENTSQEAVVLASPQPPFAVPQFAGRALLRTDYWLSPGDELEHSVIDAFAGDPAAQAEAMKHADFLVLRAAEQPRWQISTSEAVYRNDSIQIHRLTD